MNPFRRPLIQRIRSDHVVHSVLNLSRMQSILSPGKVHVDVGCLLRGFPGEQLWDGRSIRRSSGQSGLISSVIQG